MNGKVYGGLSQSLETQITLASFWVKRKLNGMACLIYFWKRRVERSWRNVIRKTNN